ncbi:unnamed protein product [Zymoseptoria tritici ST99CH_1A5]|uniref:Uncharacterized protein n=1 Tax=Zymoseptoria tritici ST99CH_1A5 TaxID=1276529 RepID=A0A1Y6M1S9_ZYMTR|nr:unnamed protein product [Zymoseptoria tritici ST99CH_1A5]
MAATYDYKLARPLVAKFFSDNSIGNIAALTPTLLNHLHDQLPLRGSGSLDEANCKGNLLRWIRRNLSEYDTGYGARFGAAKLIAQSMIEREDLVPTTTEKETPGGGGGGGGCDGFIVIAGAASSQRGATDDVAMVDAYSSRESPSTISRGDGNKVRVKLEEKNNESDVVVDENILAWNYNILDLSRSSAEKKKMKRKATRTTRQHEPTDDQDVHLVSQHSRVSTVPLQAAAAAAAAASTSKPGAIFKTAGDRHIPDINPTTTPEWSSSSKAKMVSRGPSSRFDRPLPRPPYPAAKQAVSLTQQALHQIFTSAEMIFARGAYPSCLVEVSRAMTLVCTVIEADRTTGQSEALHEQGVHDRAAEVEGEVEVDVKARLGDYVGGEGGRGEEVADWGGSRGVEVESNCQEGWGEAEDDDDDDDDDDDKEEEEEEEEEDDDEVSCEGGDDEGEWEDED